MPDCPEEWEPPPLEPKSSSEDKPPSASSLRDSPPPSHHLKSNTSTHSEYYPTTDNRAASPAPPIPSASSTAKHSSPSPHAQRDGTRDNSVATVATRSTSKGTRSLSKGTRSQSKSGGVQVTVGATGSWAQLANPSATLPADSVNGTDGGKHHHHGILTNFLSRKKGRDRSPKPHENGVLGKEGARVVINSGGR